MYIDITVHAIAVKTATSICPLYSRSLHPPPAFFRRLYHGVDPSEAVGLRKSARKFIDPQFGWNSVPYSPLAAEREQLSQDRASKKYPKSIERERETICKVMLNDMAYGIRIFSIRNIIFLSPKMRVSRHLEPSWGAPWTWWGQNCRHKSYCTKKPANTHSEHISCC